ncbi:MAG TPA: NAD(P)H-binding protein [Dehalococcoidia bacterium]|nr:NAD(P)H-binding protein [Dehalococcoidia bacterium]
MQVLVTGATGRLGGVLVPALLGAGHEVRALSRQQQVSEQGETWSVADIDSPCEALAAAVDGIEAIVHCASNSPTAEATDVAGTGHLLDAASEAGVGHLLYVSIVGIDAIHTPYYGAKLAAERIVGGSPLRSTILRTTQFHDLLREWLVAAASGRAMLAGELRFRPVDTLDVASRIAALLAAGPGGRARDLAGPEVLNGEQMAQALAAATGGAVELASSEDSPLAATFGGTAHLGDDNIDTGRVTFAQAVARESWRPL